MKFSKDIDLSVGRELSNPLTKNNQGDEFGIKASFKIKKDTKQFIKGRLSMYIPCVVKTAKFTCCCDKIGDPAPKEPRIYPTYDRIKSTYLKTDAAVIVWDYIQMGFNSTTYDVSFAGLDVGPISIGF